MLLQLGLWLFTWLHALRWNRRLPSRYYIASFAYWIQISIKWVRGVYTINDVVAGLKWHHVLCTLFFGSTRPKPRLPWTSSNIHQINSIRKLRTLVLCSRPHLVRPCWIFRSFRSLVVLYPNPLDAYFPRSVLRSAWTVDGPTTALDQIPFYLRFHGPIQMSVYLHRRFHAMLKNLTRSLVMLTLLMLLLLQPQRVI